MIENNRNCSLEARQSYLLEFFDVSVRKDDQVLLQNVSGYAAPGEILALMGPVGAGKTTLLNLLTSRHYLTHTFDVEGKFHLNGKVADTSHLLDIGYVMQDDILFAKMTLRETIRFYALVRLPDHMDKKAKIHRANEVIEMVGLSANMDTVIGGGIVRGLSGGERKRVSVAIELLNNPSLLFLDEPTSGLDSSIAFMLIRLIRNLTTKHQLTVVCSIHQPNTQIFYLFDNLLLLGHGQPFYFGNVNNLAAYFNTVGQPCPRGWNVADYAVDVIQNDQQIIKQLLEGYKVHCNPHVTDYSLHHIETHQTTSISNVAVSVDGTASDLNPAKKLPNEHKKKTRKYLTSFSTQFTTLLRRSFFNSISQYWTILNFAENILLGALISAIWWFTPFDTVHFVSIRGLIFFICSSVVLQPLYSFIFGIPKDAIVIIRETMANNYSFSAYLITKQLSEIPILLSRPFIFVTVFYWLVGFKYFHAYVFTYLILVLVSLVSYIVAVCLGCTGLSQRETISLALIFLILSIAFGGFFSRSAPSFMKWARFLSPIYHGYCLLFLLHFSLQNGIKCSVDDKIFSSCGNGSNRVPMSELLSFDDINVPFYTNIIALLLYVMVFELLTYFCLQRSLNPEKKKLSCKIKLLKNKKHFKDCV